MDHAGIRVGRRHDAGRLQEESGATAATATAAAAAPTASLTANPNTVDKGQSTTLTWQTTNATDVSIDGIGAVQASGSQQVTPADSTTYHLTAKGAGGTQEATARVTVNAPPPPPPPADRRRPKRNCSRRT